MRKQTSPSFDRYNKTDLTIEQKNDLVAEIYHKGVVATESLEYCNLGMILFYLVGAILSAGAIQLHEFNDDLNAREFFENNFDDDSFVWQFIEYVNIDD